MVDETFAFEVKDLLIQFMDALDDITIRRFNSNRDAVDKFRVTMVYAPKQRTLSDIVNRSKAIILPVISVYQGGITRDPDRVFNKILGAYYDPGRAGSDVAEHLRQPLPINLTVNVSIIARYQNDIDQIITNFVPYFDPYIVIEWSIPNFKHRINTQVFWNENINFTYPTDISADTAWSVSADTSFTIKGWLFKSQKVGIGKIYTIDSKYAVVKELPTGYLDLSTDPGSLYQTDSFEISARPQSKLLSPNFANIGNDSLVYNLYGDMYFNTINVFLSGATNIFPLSALSAIDTFSTNTALSSLFPSFSAIPVTSFDIINNNKITFTIPAPIASGNLDVIVLNPAGYSKLRIDSIIPTYNPFLSGDEFYDDYIQPQTLSVSGLIVI